MKGNFVGGALCMHDFNVVLEKIIWYDLVYHLSSFTIYLPSACEWVNQASGSGAAHS